MTVFYPKYKHFNNRGTTHLGFELAGMSTPKCSKKLSTK